MWFIPGGSPSGQFCPLWGHWAGFGPVLCCQNCEGVVLESGGLRPRLQLNILQYTEQLPCPPTQANTKTHPVPNFSSAKVKKPCFSSWNHKTATLGPKITPAGSVVRTVSFSVLRGN